MADIKINDLAAASAATTSQQFETDVGGTTAEKVTGAQIKTFVNTSPAISGGTINNAIIGGSTPAAATFTTATATDVVTEDVQASGSAGVIIKNSGGTAVLTAGAGAGTGVSTAGGLNVGGAITVTSGTINGTTVGATTPSTGAFTDVSATGTLTVTGAAALNGGITMGGTEAITSGRTLRATSGSAGTPAHSFSADSNTGAYRKGADQYAIAVGGLDALEVNLQASAVNFLSLTNSAAGADVTLATAGTDTDIDLAITPKGAGALVLDGLRWPTADGTSSQVLQTNGSGTLSFATVSGGGGSVGPYCIVRRSTTQSVTDNTATTIQFNSEVADPNNIFDSVTDFRLEPGAGQYGLYWISVQCGITVDGADNANTNLARLQLNAYGSGAGVLSQSCFEYKDVVLTGTTAGFLQTQWTGLVYIDGSIITGIDASIQVNNNTTTSSTIQTWGNSGTSFNAVRLIAA